MESASTTSPAVAENPFAPSEFERRKARMATRNKWIMFCFCALLITPLVLILVDIFVKAWPLFSWHYVWDNPSNKGKEGGLWAPLVGTFYLVIGSLLFVAPIGIFAAIYLNEYAREGPLNRAIGIAVTSLAGVPSIVHALFGLGAFVLGMLPAINHLIADSDDPQSKWEAGLLTASLTV